MTRCRILRPGISKACDKTNLRTIFHAGSIRHPRSAIHHQSYFFASFSFGAGPFSFPAGAAAAAGSPSAFFSVSASAASRDESGRRDAEVCMARFLDDTHWQPASVESIAGAMAFTKYNVFYRWILKQISKRSGGPTDTSRDHELTDWAQVQQFAEEFLSAVAGGVLNGAG